MLFVVVRVFDFVIFVLLFVWLVELGLFLLL